MLVAKYNRHIPTKRLKRTSCLNVMTAHRRRLVRYTSTIFAAAPLLLVAIHPAHAAQATQPAPATQPTEPAPFRQWATTLTQRINHEFKLPSHLYAEYRPRDKHDHPAYMWPSNVELRSLVAAAVVAPKTYSSQMMQFLAALKKAYLVKVHGIWGFNASAHGRHNRFYDDNGGTLIALMEVYSVNRSPAVLSTAEKIMAFMLSGEDKVQGGGIYEREKTRIIKAATSTIQATVGGLLLYKATHQKKYLDDAHRLDHWMAHTLKAPNGLFYMNINARTGKVKKIEMAQYAAYSIMAQLLFYDISGKRSYLNSAISMAKVAEKKFVGKKGQFHRPGKWVFKLADVFLDLYVRTENTHWLKVVERGMTFVHQHACDTRGHYGESWGATHVKTLHKWHLINQACVARVYWRLAACQSPKGSKKIGLLTLGYRYTNQATCMP